MSEKLLMKGNEAIAEAAIRAGCRAYFGYPITPQTQIIEYLSKRMPEVGGVCLQAESEVAAINMVYGAAATGAKVMTSSSGPGFSLKAEGISYLAGAELPAVLINVMRAGPGLGGIHPSQADYKQATRGVGHGDAYMITLAPNSIQECMDFVKLAFNLADKYRNPVIILADGLLGQMMEPVELPAINSEPEDPKPWALTGKHGRGNPNVVNSLNTIPEELEVWNLKLKEKYETITHNEQRSEYYGVNNPELLVVAYGTTSRIAHSAVEQAIAENCKVGLIRPISLWPYPFKAIADSAVKAKNVLVAEMNNGQMVDDVRLAIKDAAPVRFFGRNGGIVPSVNEIYDEIIRIYKGEKG